MDETGTGENAPALPPGPSLGDLIEDVGESGGDGSRAQANDTGQINRTEVDLPRKRTRRIAGMVGQVNGRAVYAHQVLEPLHEQLISLGQRYSRDEFRMRVEPLIYERLTEIVQNALVLAEAQRDLSERERQGLKAIMRHMREELVRKHGRGSPAVADRVLHQQTGQGLEQTLEDRRQSLIVDRYMQRKLHPRVNVTLRDMERYYHDHFEQFNPSATRTLRLIRAAGEREAQIIKQRLEEDEPFPEVAADGGLNAYRSTDGGLMADAPGDEVFGHEPLNIAMRQLDEGEYAGPIDAGGEQWFLKVEKIDRPERQSFKEAQREIEQRLRLQQLNRLGSEYYEQLLERGSFNPLEQMADDLIEIALDRYSAWDPESGRERQR